MKRILQALVLLFLFATVTYAQRVSPKEFIGQRTLLRGPSEETAVKVFDIDTAFYMIGTLNNTVSAADASLMMMNRAFKNIAASTFDVDGLNKENYFKDGYYNSLNKTLYLTGIMHDTIGVDNISIMLFVLNSANSITHVRKIGESNKIIGVTKRKRDEIGNSIAVAADGSVIIAGQIIYHGEDTNAYIYNLKSDYTTRNWGYNLNLDGYSFANKVITDNNGLYVLTGAGTNNETGGNNDLIMYRFKADGSVDQSKILGDALNVEVGNDVIQTSDNGYLVLGTTRRVNLIETDIFLVKFNSNLSPVWTATYSRVGSDFGVGIAPAFDGGYIIAGHCLESTVGGKKDAVLIKIDDAGKIVWSKAYGGSGTEQVYGFTALNSDKSYILSGTTNSPDFGSTTKDLYLVKVDYKGKVNTVAPCFTDTIIYTVAFVNSPSSSLPSGAPKSITLSTVSFVANPQLPIASFTQLCLDTIPSLRANAGKDDTICLSKGKIIGGAPTAKGGNAPYQYSWTPVAGLSNAAIANPKANPVANQTYIVKVTDNLGRIVFDTVKITAMGGQSGAFTGLDSTYCTSSMLSILTPATAGSLMYGTGVHFNGVIWYFKAEDAGPGTYKIMCVPPDLCDTVIHTTTVQPAPCIADIVEDTTAGAIKSPQGIFTDCAGQIYVSNELRITMLDSFGINSILAGPIADVNGYTDGLATTDARMNKPIGITGDPWGNIYFADHENSAIRMIKRGVIDSLITIAGSLPVPLGLGSLQGNVNGVRGVSVFDRPFGITFDDTRNCLYVSEYFFGRIRKISLKPGDKYITTTLISGLGVNDINTARSAAQAKIYQPKHISIKGNDLYITDFARQMIYRYDLAKDSIYPFAGKYNVKASNDGPKLGPGSMAEPSGINVNCNGIVYFTEANTLLNKIREVKGNNISTYPDNDGLLNGPTAISVFVKGFLDVASTGNDKILRLTINDWKIGPWIGLDTSDFIYCQGEGPDTLNPIYDCGFYKGPGISFNAGIGKYVFTPPAAVGTYTIKYIFKNSFCDDSMSVKIKIAANPIYSYTPKPVNLCAGGNVSLTVSDTTYKKYKWSTGSVSQSITVNAAGTYNVTVSDRNHCSDTSAAIVVSRALPNANVTAAPNPACSGANVTLDASTSTGSAPITYAWSTGQSGVSALVIAPASNTRYRVTATDLYACTNSDSVLLNVLASPVANAGPDDTICFGSAKTIGTAGAYIYSWTNAALLSNGAIAQPAVKVTTPANTIPYEFVLTTTQSTCSDKDTVVILITDAPSVNLGVNDSICKGTGPVTITALVTGGVAPYTYAWSVAGVTNSITVNPLVTTSYNVTVSDPTGCSGNKSKQVYISTPIANAGADKGLCLGDSIALGAAPTVTGGISPVSITWSPAVGISKINIANPKAKPLVLQDYIVNISDKKGCTDADTIRITVHTPPTAAIVATKDTICALVDSARLTGSGGVSCIWQVPTTGLKTPGACVTWAKPLNSIRYILQITDVNSCKDTLGYPIVVVNPMVTVSPDTTICAGQPVRLIAKATGATTYSWSPATNLSTTNNDTTIATPIVSRTYTISASGGGLACPAVDTVRIKVLTITANAGVDIAICKGDSIAIGAAPSVLGGTAPVSITWSLATGLSSTTVPNPWAKPSSTRDYILNLNDAMGCKDADTVKITVYNLPIPLIIATKDTICAFIDSTQLTASGGLSCSWLAPTTGLKTPGACMTWANPLATSRYVVRVTDANSCKDTIGYKIIVINPSVLVTPHPDTSICIGQSVKLTAFALGTTSYIWSPVTNLSDANNDTTMASPNVSRTYTISASGGSGCPAVDTVRIIVSNIQANAGLSKNICFADSVKLGGKAIQGIEPYTYVWSPNIGVDSVEWTTPPMSSPYNVTATDAIGCTDAATATITIMPLPTANAGVDTTICSGDSMVIGGSPTSLAGNKFKWSPSATINIDSIANPKSKALFDTRYKVTVTDNVSKCKNIDSMNLTVLPFPGVSKVNDSICLGQSISLSAWGGTDYKWSPPTYLSDTTSNPVTSTPDKILSITYQVIISSNFCATDTQYSTIKVNPLPNITANRDTILFAGEIFTLSADSGVTYVWNPSTYMLNAADTNSKNPQIQPLAKTFYEVIGTNKYGCSSTDTVLIDIIEKLDIFVAKAFSPNGDGINDTLCVQQVGMLKMKWTIFNSWGQIVYESNDLYKCWDGSFKGNNQGMQTFGYILEAEDYKGEIHVSKGTITILK